MTLNNPLLNFPHRKKQCFLAIGSVWLDMTRTGCQTKPFPHLTKLTCANMKLTLVPQQGQDLAAQRSAALEFPVLNPLQRTKYTTNHVTESETNQNINYRCQEMHLIITCSGPNHS